MSAGYPYQTTHYYADGHIKNNSTGTSFQPYLYSGKDLDKETVYYYYGARYYDPGTVLWFGTDPLQHKYPMNSPYVYCNGNPVRYVDPLKTIKVLFPNIIHTVMLLRNGEC